ncbi:MAG: TIM barrel protein [Chloroflexi bacterium]|nr:xylose isomerase [Chloroflexota bacterium]MBV6436982.1 Inosose dehydratase [Anaerolineae bacterium]MBW7877710.1 TIM barrel protein [Anaerolineae bacterium]MCC6564217.1 TIM barrel protein [Chloroflexota bacterium]MEB2366361.1 TIM barrel protein [Chloroflexota bacterium]
MTIRIATAPVCWGIFEFEGAVQRYTPDQVLDQIKEAGYDALEYGPWGFMPSDPVVLQAALDARGLKLLSSFVPVPLVDPARHDEALANALKFGRVLAACGAHHVVLADDSGSVPELVKQAGRRSGSLLDAAAWAIVGEAVNRIAREIHDQLGLETVFHHHCAGYVETPEETARLLDATDPALVGLCLDTGHYHFAGGDAVECIHQHGERVRYLHLKDFDPAVKETCDADEADYFEAVKRGVFCELGHGAVDFPGVMKAMEALGYDGWAIVEQDVLVEDIDAPKQAVARNRQYLRSIGY